MKKGSNIYFTTNHQKLGRHKTRQLHQRNNHLIALSNSKEEQRAIGRQQHAQKQFYFVVKVGDGDRR